MDLRLLRRCAIAVAGVFLSLPGWSTGGEFITEDLGCGRARAADARFRDEGAFGPTLVEFPGDTDVLSCNLEIELLPTTGSIIGRNTMAVKSLSPTLNEFTIRLNNNFDSTIHVVVDGVTASWVRMDQATLKVILPRTYGQNEQFAMAVDYSGRPRSLGYGSFRITTGSVSTMSEPYFAYTWWPAKDDNADKFTLDLWITCPRSLVVPSNGILVRTEDLPGNRKRHHWRESYPIATYLVSIAADDFDTMSLPYEHAGGTMPVIFYTHGNGQWERSMLQASVKMLGVFRDLFGEYPFINEKYGVYDFGQVAGMEHQTISGQSFFVEEVTAHELAHQWWGDMITCKTWHDVWLNEGFATYSEALWAERRPGSPGLPALHSYMATKRSLSSDSLYRTDLRNPDHIFDATVYDKGAWVLHQLRHVVGDTKFFQILAHYRSLYEYGSATSDDFARAAEFVYGKDLRWYFDRWVYGTGTPGYFLGRTQTVVNGKHYLLLWIRQRSTYPPFTMPIDLSWDASGGRIQRVIWNDALEENYVIPVDGPLDLNRVKLDENNWIYRDVFNSAYVPRGPKIVETSPVPGASMESNDPIEVTFHTDVNTTAADYSLAGKNSGPRPFNFSYSRANFTATLSPTEPLPTDTYSLTVRDTITAVNSGKRLDGEITNPDSPASLPSGEGQPLGSSMIRFSVSGDKVARLTGKVALADLAGELIGLPLTIQVRANGQTVETVNTMLDASGSYHTAMTHEGTVDLIASIDRWLSVKASGVELLGTLQQNWLMQYAGDTDSNNLIDDADVSHVLLAFGATGSSLAGDVNVDGVVDEADLTLVLQNFGRQGED